MSEKKFYFKLEIDPRLTKIWDKLGFDEDKVKEEINCLADCLFEAYNNFVEESENTAKEYEDAINALKNEYLQIKHKFKLSKNLPLIENSMKLTNQISFLSVQVSEIKEETDKRMRKFVKIESKLRDLFNEMKIPMSERQGFSLADSDDFSLTRLNLFKEKLIDLENMKNTRILALEEATVKIEEIIKLMNCEMDANIKYTINNRRIDIESLTAVTKYSKELQEMYIEMKKKYEETKKNVIDLYKLLIIDEEEQIQIPGDISQESLRILEDELEFLKNEANERIPVACEELRKQIKEYEDFCQLPKTERKRFIGSNNAEEIVFLHSYLDYLLNIKEKVEEIFECSENINKVSPRKASSMSRKLDNLQNEFYSLYNYVLKIPQK